jgi:fatty-acyl-CoA synthase
VLPSRLPSEAATLGDLLAILARIHEGRWAVRGEHSQLSFRALDQTADRWARALVSADCGPGRRVGLLAANRPEWLAVAFGTWRAGATLVPLSTFVTGRELAENLVDAALDLLVVQPRVASQDFVTMLDVVPRSHRPPLTVCLAETAPMPLRTAAAFLQSGVGKPTAAIDPESVACLLYTSGTSGRPKGVMLSHRGILATVPETARRSGLTPDDYMLATPPLFWVAGLVIRALPTLAAGCALHLLEAFRVDQALDALERYRPTALHLRPPQAALLLGDPCFRPELLENVRRGTGRSEWYAPHLDSGRVRFTTGYGMTEMSGYVMSSDWRDLRKPGEEPRARLMPDVQVRIVDEQGRDCPTGEVGEICLRGPGMFSGYCNQPAGTGLDERGFFTSGDLGRLRPDGALDFVGRRKDLLRAKGINVSPLEVESVLAVHPNVEAVYVVGVPASGSDQRLIALVVTRDGQSVPTEDLFQLAQHQLSGYKRPEMYVHVKREQVPLGPTQKPNRDALGALAAAHIRGAE